MKQKLEEDMMLYPESYSQDDSDYMTEAELRSQMNEAKTFIKEHFTVCIIPDKKEKE